MKQALIHSMARFLPALIASPAYAGQGAVGELSAGRLLGYGLLVIALLGIVVAFRPARAQAPLSPLLPPGRGEFRHGFAAAQSQPPVANRAKPQVPRRLPGAAPPAAITVAAAPDFAGNTVIARLRQRWGEAAVPAGRDHGAGSSGK